MLSTQAVIHLPGWLQSKIDEYDELYIRKNEDRMKFVLDITRKNIKERTGGPFGAAIFERDLGRLVSVGVNVVVPQTNCTAHAEMVAFMMAGQYLNSHTMKADGMPAYQLIASAQPCAMCLGATVWSGVRELIYGSLRSDIQNINHFDEGPIPHNWKEELENRGINIIEGLCRDEAIKIHYLYEEMKGVLY